MNSLLKKSRYSLIIDGSLIVLFVFSGCQIDHLSQWETNVFVPSSDSFIVLGDNHFSVETSEDSIESVTSIISSAKCYIYIGDNSRNQMQWISFLNPSATVDNVKPCYTGVKNHDIESLATQQIYQKVLRQTSEDKYYSFDLFDCHFIVLDTEFPSQMRGVFDKQLAWLQNDLKRNANSSQYLFVFTYLPLYSQEHYQEKNLANADELHRLFSQYGVDIVFSGNEHKYYIHQKDSVHYVGTGGKSPNYMKGLGARSNHYLLIELLHPDNILVHKMDAMGRLIQTDIAPVN
jgi:hypothetical protein